MSRWIFVWLLFPCFQSARTDQAPLQRFHFTENKMGSPFNLIFYHTDSSEAASIAKECFLIVDTLNEIFSDYSTKSEVGRLALQPARSPVKVSAELFAMLVASRQAWMSSGGSFDITIGALTHLWRKAKAENRFPSDTEIKKAMQASGFANLVLDARSKTISFSKNEMLLDFGGIAKGYAAQKIIDHLRANNIVIALADAGGDIVVGDPPPGKRGWSISINFPEQADASWDRKLELKNCAVATSGDIYRYYSNNGKKYSHIIDPRTGYGITSQRNVTVVAKDGATADCLATACSILSIKKALALAGKEKAGLFIAALKDEKIVIHRTKNFDSNFEKNETPELR